MAGVGVVLVAAIASLLHGEWLILIQIIVGVVIVYVLRIAGHWLVEKSEATSTTVTPDPTYVRRGLISPLNVQH